MGGDQHRLPLDEIGLDALLPVGEEALDDVLEALGLRQLVAEVGVLRVLVLGELGAELDLGRRRVVGAAPGHELLLAVLLADLRLVHALQRAVVALVQAPVALDGDPVAVGRIQGEVRGHDGAALQRGVHDIGEDAGLLHEVAALRGLLASLLGEGDVHPAGEQVLRVPVALAVAEQHECVGHGHSLRGPRPAVHSVAIGGHGRGRIPTRPTGARRRGCRPGRGCWPGRGSPSARCPRLGPSRPMTGLLDMVGP